MAISKKNWPDLPSGRAVNPESKYGSAGLNNALISKI